MSKEAMKLAISRLEWFVDSYPHDITTSKEEFLRPFKEALAKQEQPLLPVEIGVDVTLEGTAVTAFYCRPDAVMEVFYSQFHPQPKQEQGEPVTLLPDGSAFGVMSFPLPDDHWIYAPNEYRDGEYEPIDLPKPILTHALRDEVVAAVRYAVRGATMRGQEQDFDPDALVQNAVYALCGPYTTPQQRKPLTDEQITALLVELCVPKGYEGVTETFTAVVRTIEAAHGIKE